MTSPSPYQPPDSAETKVDKPVSYRDLWSTGFVAVVLFLLVSAFRSTVLPLMLAVLIVPVQALLLPIAFLRKRRQEGAVRLRLLKSGIYGVMLVAMFLSVAFEQGIARARADQIVEACHGYEKDHGHLPADLSLLVPDYLPVVRERLGLLSLGGYSYSPPRGERSAIFMYFVEPFTSAWYDFETRTWRIHASYR